MEHTCATINPGCSLGAGGLNTIRCDHCQGWMSVSSTSLPHAVFILFTMTKRVVFICDECCQQKDEATHTTNVTCERCPRWMVAMPSWDPATRRGSPETIPETTVLAFSGCANVRFLCYDCKKRDIGEYAEKANFLYGVCRSTSCPKAQVSNSKTMKRGICKRKFAQVKRTMHKRTKQMRKANTHWEGQQLTCIYFHVMCCDAMLYRDAICLFCID
jgi:hypothetical protein